MQTEAENKLASESPVLEELFRVGAHFGYTRARRHPSVKPFIFGVKNYAEIVDLEATEKALSAAKAFISALSAMGKQILLVGGKSEAREAVRSQAESLGLPYVAGRFIGGTLTNFAQIRRRVERMEKLLSEKETGELNRYTKKERLLLDREMEKLKLNFGGIVSMKALPAALFVVDPRKEHIAVSEARKLQIPVVALANTDCDLSLLSYAIPGNDSARASIEYFVKEIASAYREGRAPESPATVESSSTAAETPAV